MDFVTCLVWSIYDSFERQWSATYKGTGSPLPRVSAGMGSGIGVIHMPLATCHLPLAGPISQTSSSILPPADQLECAIWSSLSQLAPTRLPELDCGLYNPQ